MNSSIIFGILIFSYLGYANTYLDDFVRTFPKIVVSLTMEEDNENSLTFNITFSNEILNCRVKPVEKTNYGETIVEIHEETDINSYNLKDLYLNNLYEGNIENNPNWKLQGYFLKDLFNGIIQAESQTFHIESFENEANNSNVNSIWYEVNDELTNSNESTNFDENNISISSLRILPQKNGENNETLFDESQLKLCSLQLVADHTFYEEYRTIENVISKMYYHIKHADTIFRSLDFNEDGERDNIGFVIRKVTIYKTRNYTDFDLGDPINDSDVYLSEFSKRNELFCLSIGFTHRLFAKGVMGASYIAVEQKRGYKGGICEKRFKFPDGYYKTNVAIVTTKGVNGKVKSSETNSAVVHEIGHCFGSQHDEDEHEHSEHAHENCVKTTTGWGYIMTISTSQGDHPHNYQFSECSIRAMRKVIEDKGLKCFEFYNGSYCGNTVVEDGEECDCGTDSICQQVDPCCIPSNKKQGCKLNRGKGFECSYRANPCCGKNCKGLSNPTSKSCFANIGVCAINSICDKSTFQCAKRSLNQNETCQQKICLEKNLETCTCSGFSCYTCCVIDGKCTLWKAEESLVPLPRGMPCESENGKNGECNMLGKCNDELKSKPKENVIWLNANWSLLLFFGITFALLTLVGGSFIYYNNNIREERSSIFDIVLPLRNRRAMPVLTLATAPTLSVSNAIVTGPFDCNNCTNHSHSMENEGSTAI